MAQPVSDKRNQAVGLTQLIENHFYKIDVHHLPVAAEIINLARFPLEKRSHDGSAMIRNMDPIANVQPVTINWEWFVTQRLDDHERNQLFGKLIWPVIVGAARHQHFLAVGLVTAKGEQICTRFAG